MTERRRSDERIWQTDVRLAFDAPCPLRYFPIHGDFPKRSKQLAHFGSCRTSRKELGTGHDRIV